MRSTVRGKCVFACVLSKVAFFKSPTKFACFSLSIINCSTELQKKSLYTNNGCFVFVGVVLRDRFVFVGLYEEVLATLVSTC